MSRPINSKSKQRRRYIVVTIDPHFYFRKIYYRDGYKHLILREFNYRFPDLNIEIYVLSDTLIRNS